MLSDVIIIVAQNITAIGIIGGAIFYIWRKLFPVIKNTAKLFDDIAEIKKEFVPNGGTSLRDSINRLEVGVTSLAQDAARHEARSVVATLRDPIWESNSKGECVRASSSYLTLAERRLEDVIGFGWENMIHSEDRSKVWEEWEDAVKRKRSFELTYRVVAKNSLQVYTVDAVSIPYFDQKTNELLGFVGTFINARASKEVLDKAA